MHGFCLNISDNLNCHGLELMQAKEQSTVESPRNGRKIINIADSYFVLHMQMHSECWGKIGIQRT